MLGAKAGVLHLHLGDGRRRLEMLFRLIRETEIPPTQVIPTHVNRNRELFSEAIQFALAGGGFDLTAGPDPTEGEGEVSVAEAIRFCRRKKVPLGRVSVSSDSNGSLPVFDQAGNLVGLTIASQRSLLGCFQSLLRRKIVGLEEAARLFSANAAAAYGLSTKGALRPGLDADIILLDDGFELKDVFARGRRMLVEGRLLARRTFRPAETE
jgi:beta-aspartyl-dipeptidase (metallo-type)